MKQQSREQWLNAAVAEFRGWFKRAGFTVPKQVRVSTGFPSRKALSAGNKAIGQCWPPTASSDGHVEIFVSPLLGDAARVLDVLIHELCHAAAGNECGHKGNFRKAALALGLTGSMTATTATPELVKRLNTLIRKIGKYPHAALNAGLSGIKKQGTRMIKVSCCDCGYAVRTTQKWIEQGLPTCCCGGEFEVE